MNLREHMHGRLPETPQSQYEADQRPVAFPVDLAPDFFKLEQRVQELEASNKKLLSMLHTFRREKSDAAHEHSKRMNSLAKRLKKLETADERSLLKTYQRTRYET